MKLDKSAYAYTETGIWITDRLKKVFNRLDKDHLTDFKYAQMCGQISREIRFIKTGVMTDITQRFM